MQAHSHPQKMRMRVISEPWRLRLGNGFHGWIVQIGLVAPTGACVAGCVPRALRYPLLSAGRNAATPTIPPRVPAV